MISYITADIRRFMQKQSFLGAFGSFFGLFALLVFIYFNPSFTQDMYVAKITSFLSFFPLIVGLFIFMSVYADDFKSKSMQVAIGYGIDRKKVVLSKLLESTFILMGIGLISTVMILLVPSAIGIGLNSEQRIPLVLTIASELLRTLGYISMATIPVFFTQNSVDGIIFYVLFSTKFVLISLTMILGQGFIMNTIGDLTQYLFTVQLYNAKDVLLHIGSFEVLTLFSLLLYIILPTIITMAGFEKKELEF